MTDPRLSEANKHAVLVMAELDDWEGVEGTLDEVVDAYWSDPKVRAKVLDGIERDLNAPPTVADTFWSAFFVCAAIGLYAAVMLCCVFFGKASL